MSTIVVGAGLFGSVVAAALRAKGEEVTVIDRGEAWAGSKPAACLMKPSWMSGLPVDVRWRALELLDELYGLQTLRFQVGPLRQDVHWVPPSSVLREPDIRANVAAISRHLGDEHWRVDIEVDGVTTPLYDKRVVVAAGIWTPALLPLVQVTGQLGCAFTWPTRTTQDQQEGRITPWAPYRQLVAFQRQPDELWVGDGSTWRTEYAAKLDAAQERCATYARRSDPPRRLMGWRPYVKDAKPCLLEELQPGLWVATGGAKNGTVAAAWCGAVISGRTKV